MPLFTPLLSLSLCSLCLSLSTAIRHLQTLQKNRAQGRQRRRSTKKMENTQICYCGRIGKVNCSWTDSNPGRRFIGCELYGKSGACGFFLWVDPPMCPRAMVVIPGLIRSLARQEALVKKGQRKVACLWVALIISWGLGICAYPLVWLYKWNK